MSFTTMSRKLLSLLLAAIMLLSLMQPFTLAEGESEPDPTPEAENDEAIENEPITIELYGAGDDDDGTEADTVDGVSPLPAPQTDIAKPTDPVTGGSKLVVLDSKWSVGQSKNTFSIRSSDADSPATVKATIIGSKTQLGTDGFIVAIPIPEDDQPIVYFIENVGSAAGVAEDFFGSGKDAYLFKFYFSGGMGDSYVVLSELQFRFENGYTPNDYTWDIEAFFYPAVLPEDFNAEAMAEGAVEADYLTVDTNGTAGYFPYTFEEQSYEKITLKAVAEDDITVTKSLVSPSSSMTEREGRAYSEVYSSKNSQDKAKANFVYKIDIKTSSNGKSDGRIFQKSVKVTDTLSGLSSGAAKPEVKVYKNEGLTEPATANHTWNEGTGTITFDVFSGGEDGGEFNDTTYYMVLTYYKDSYTDMCFTDGAAKTDLITSTNTAYATYQPVTETNERTSAPCEGVVVSFGWYEMDASLPTFSFRNKISVAGQADTYTSAYQEHYGTTTPLSFKLTGIDGATTEQTATVDETGKITFANKLTPGTYRLAINDPINGSNFDAPSANAVVVAETDVGTGIYTVQVGAFINGNTVDESSLTDYTTATYEITHTAALVTRVRVPITRQKPWQYSTDATANYEAWAYPGGLTWQEGDDGAIQLVDTSNSDAVVASVKEWSVTASEGEYYAVFENVTIGKTYKITANGVVTSGEYSYAASTDSSKTPAISNTSLDLVTTSPLRFDSAHGGLTIGFAFVSADGNIDSSIGNVKVKFNMYDSAANAANGNADDDVPSFEISGSIDSGNQYIEPAVIQKNFAAGTYYLRAFYVSADSAPSANVQAAYPFLASDTSNYIAVTIVAGKYDAKPTANGNPPDSVSSGQGSDNTADSATLGTYLHKSNAGMLRVVTYNGVDNTDAHAGFAYKIYEAIEDGGSYTRGALVKQLPDGAPDASNTPAAYAVTLPVGKYIIQPVWDTAKWTSYSGATLTNYADGAEYLLMASGGAGDTVTTAVSGVTRKDIGYVIEVGIGPASGAPSVTVAADDANASIGMNGVTNTVAFAVGYPPTASGKSRIDGTDADLSGFKFATYRKDGDNYVKMSAVSDGAADWSITSAELTDVPYAAGEYITIEWSMYKPDERFVPMAYRDASGKPLWVNWNQNVSKTTVAASDLTAYMSIIPQFTVKYSDYSASTTPSTVDAGTVTHTQRYSVDMIAMDATTSAISTDGRLGSNNNYSTFLVEKYANAATGWTDNDVDEVRIMEARIDGYSGGKHDLWLFPGYTYVFSMYTPPKGGTGTTYFLNTQDKIYLRIEENTHQAKSWINSTANSPSALGSAADGVAMESGVHNTTNCRINAGAIVSQWSEGKPDLFRVRLGTLKAIDVEFHKEGETEETYMAEEGGGTVAEVRGTIPLAGARFVIYYLDSNNNIQFLRRDSSNNWLPVEGVQLNAALQSTPGSIGVDDITFSGTEGSAFGLFNPETAYNLGGESDGVFTSAANGVLKLERFPITGVGESRTTTLNGITSFYILEVWAPAIENSESVYRPGKASRFDFTADTYDKTSQQTGGSQKTFHVWPSLNSNNRGDLNASTDTSGSGPLVIVNKIEPHYIMIEKLGIEVWEGEFSKGMNVNDKFSGDSAQKEALAKDWVNKLCYMIKSFPDKFGQINNSTETWQVDDLENLMKNFTANVSAQNRFNLLWDENDGLKGFTVPTNYGEILGAYPARNLEGGSVSVFAQRDYNGDGSIDTTDMDYIVSKLDAGAKLADTERPVAKMSLTAVKINGTAHAGFSNQLPNGKYWIVETDSDPLMEKNPLYLNEGTGDGVGSQGGSDSAAVYWAAQGRYIEVDCTDPDKEVTYVRVGNSDHMNDSTRPSEQKALMYVYADKVGYIFNEDGDPVAQGFLNGVKFELRAAYFDPRTETYVPIGPVIETMVSGSAQDALGNQLSGRIQSSLINTRYAFTNVVYRTGWYIAKAQIAGGNEYVWKEYTLKGEGVSGYAKSVDATAKIAEPFTEAEMKAYEDLSAYTDDEALLTALSGEAITATDTKTPIRLSDEFLAIEIDGKRLYEANEDGVNVPLETAEIQNIIESWGRDFALVEISAPAGYKSSGVYGLTIPAVTGQTTFYSLKYTMSPDDTGWDPETGSNTNVYYRRNNSTTNTGTDADKDAALSWVVPPGAPYVTINTQINAYNEAEETARWEGYGAYDSRGNNVNGTTEDGGTWGSLLKNEYTHDLRQGAISSYKGEGKITVRVTTDTSNTALSGAVFGLYKSTAEFSATNTTFRNPSNTDYTDGKLVKVGTITIDEADKDTGVTVAGLQPGYYYLIEEKAPEGHLTLGWFTASGGSTGGTKNGCAADPWLIKDYYGATGMYAGGLSAYGCIGGKPFGGAVYHTGNNNGTKSIQPIGPIRVSDDLAPVNVIVRNSKMPTVYFGAYCDWAGIANTTTKVAYELYGVAPGVTVDASKKASDYDAGEVVYAQDGTIQGGSAATAANLPDGQYVYKETQIESDGSAYNLHPSASDGGFISFNVINGKFANGNINITDWSGWSTLQKGAVAANNVTIGNTTNTETPAQTIANAPADYTTEGKVRGIWMTLPSDMKTCTVNVSHPSKGALAIQLMKLDHAGTSGSPDANLTEATFTVELYKGSPEFAENLANIAPGADDSLWEKKDNITVTGSAATRALFDTPGIYRITQTSVADSDYYNIDPEPVYVEIKNEGTVYLKNALPSTDARAGSKYLPLTSAYTGDGGGNSGNRFYNTVKTSSIAVYLLKNDVDDNFPNLSLAAAFANFSSNANDDIAAAKANLWLYADAACKTRIEDVTVTRQSLSYGGGTVYWYLFTKTNNTPFESGTYYIRVAGAPTGLATTNRVYPVTVGGPLSVSSQTSIINANAMLAYARPAALTIVEDSQNKSVVGHNAVGIPLPKAVEISALKTTIYNEITRNKVVVRAASEARVYGLPIQLWRLVTQADIESGLEAAFDAAADTDETVGTAMWRLRDSKNTDLDIASNTIGSVTFKDIGEGQYKIVETRPTEYSYMTLHSVFGSVEKSNVISVTYNAAENKFEVTCADSVNASSWYADAWLHKGKATPYATAEGPESDSLDGAATKLTNMRHIQNAFVGWQYWVQAYDYDNYKKDEQTLTPLAGVKFALYDTEEHAKAGGSEGRLGGEAVTGDDGIAVFDPQYISGGSTTMTAWVRELTPLNGYIADPFYDPIVKKVQVTISPEGVPELSKANEIFLNKQIKDPPEITITKAVNLATASNPLNGSNLSRVYTITPTLATPNVILLHDFTVTDKGLTFQGKTPANGNFTDIPANAAPTYAITGLTFDATYYGSETDKKTVYAQINGQTDPTSWVALNPNGSTAISNTDGNWANYMNGELDSLEIVYRADNTSGSEAIVGEGFSPGKIDVAVTINKYSNKAQPEVEKIINKANVSFEYDVFKDSTLQQEKKTAESGAATVEVPLQKRPKISVSTTLKDSANKAVTTVQKGGVYTAEITLTNNGDSALNRPAIIYYANSYFSMSAKADGSADWSVVSAPGGVGDAAAFTSDLTSQGNVVMWTFPGISLAAGGSITVSAKFSLADIVAQNSLTNMAYGTSAEELRPSVLNPSGAAFEPFYTDHDVSASKNTTDFNALVGSPGIDGLRSALGIESGNADSLGRFVKAAAAYSVPVKNNLAMVKSVSIDGGNTWISSNTPYEILQSDTVMYKIEITPDYGENDVGARKITVTDILPYSGDKVSYDSTTADPADRGTTWSDNLRSLWQFDTNYGVGGFDIRYDGEFTDEEKSADIVYSTAAPTDIQTNVSDGLTGNANASDTASEDITAFAVKLSNLKLDSGESLVIMYRMKPLNSAADGSTLNSDGEDLMASSVNAVAVNNFTLYADIYLQETSTATINMSSGNRAVKLKADPITISGKVWHDADDDGEKDDGESETVSGVTVKLYKKDSGTDWVYVTSRVTDGTGLYEFRTNGTDNNSGSTLASSYGSGPVYKVEVENPAPDTYAFTQPSTLTAEDTYKSAVVTITPAVPVGEGVEAAPEKGHTGDTGLTVNEGGTYNFGLVKLGKISGTVWYDANRNGLKDNGESGSDTNGAGNVKVSLYRQGDDADAAYDSVSGDAYTDVVISDANGAYKFEKLRPGNYKVKFDKSALDSTYGVYRWTDYSANGGTNSDLVIRSGSAEETLSDKSADTGLTQGIAVTAGAESTGAADAGYTLDVNRVTGVVWEDRDLDGERDDGESGIASVPYTVWKVGETSDTMIGSGVTDTDGTYAFTDDELVRISGAEYYVVFGSAEFLNGGGYNFTLLSSQPTVPAQDKGFICSTVQQTEPGKTALDATGTTGTFSFITGTEPEVVANINAALYRYSTISGAFWYEDDGDGVKETGEGYSGKDTFGAVTAKLYKGGGAVQTVALDA
ncbi:MAG: hypothetical protein LBD85_04570, partial [Oscillospiraceae bacterium]|nr:hypothetical protein [Oscillospiraceae bacterium]